MIMQAKPLRDLVRTPPWKSDTMEFASINNHYISETVDKSEFSLLYLIELYQLYNGSLLHCYVPWNEN